MYEIGYHGTNQPIEYFDLNHLGSNQGQSRFPGIYFTKDYSQALEYAKYAVQKFGGRPIVYVAECQLDKPVERNKDFKIFDNFFCIEKFCREYFPNWFDESGRLKSYKYDYVREKAATFEGNYNLIRYASEETGIPVIEICNRLGFDSYIGYGEFAVTSPQQILSFMEVDHQLTQEELDKERLPSEESLEKPATESVNNIFFRQMAAFETKSNDYIRAARKGKPYKTMPGNRFSRRVFIKMNGGNNIWFDIDINRLFKKGSFAIKVPVVGETDQYTCTISFDEWLPILKAAIAKTGFNQLTVKRSLMEMLRFHDLKCNCTCKDFKYRHAYWLTVHNEIEGDGENRPSDITNPKDDLGKLCKHLAFTMNNKIYGDKISRIIYNYFINLKKTKKLLFDKIVAPKLGLVEETKPVEQQQPDQPSTASNETPEEKNGVKRLVGNQDQGEEPETEEETSASDDENPDEGEPEE